MKDTSIRKAWDTVTPTAAQKKRMRAALEARLREKAAEDCPDTSDLSRAEAREEKPKYEPVQPGKSGLNVFGLMAAMLALVITGGLFLKMLKGDTEESPSYAVPSHTETAPTTLPPELPDAYQEKIQTYITAMEEDWNPVQCAQNGVYFLLQDIESMDALGYTLRDIDGNGIQELVITDGDLIYDLYTLSSRGEIVRLAQSTERDRFYLSEYGHIAEVGSSGAAHTEYSYFTISSDRLLLVDKVTFDGNTDPENPWFRGEMRNPITEEEANEILDSYYHWYLPFTTFSGKEIERSGREPDSGVMKRYAEKLARILKEEKITDFCFYDYDGDARCELLLGTEDNIRVILDQVSDRNVVEITRQCDGENQGYFLCPDNVSAFWYENDQGWGCVYRSEGPNGFSLEGSVSKVGEEWYTRAYTTNPVLISQEEAEAILNKYPRLNLPWKDISRFPAALPESGEEYISTLFEEIYLPIAAEGKQLTEPGLEGALLEEGFMCSKGDGLIFWGDADVADAYLEVPMADASGFLSGPMTYFLPGTVGRFVEVRWDDSGVQYRIGTDTYHNTYPVNSAQELKAFLNADKETMLALKAAETYAEKYFASAAADMRSKVNRDSSNKLHSWDLSYEIRNLTGYDDALQRYEKDGFLEVTAEALLNDSTASCDYLTMKLVREDGQWMVSDAWLEK